MSSDVCGGRKWGASWLRTAASTAPCRALCFLTPCGAELEPQGWPWTSQLGKQSSARAWLCNLQLGLDILQLLLSHLQESLWAPSLLWSHLTVQQLQGLPLLWGPHKALQPHLREEISKPIASTRATQPFATNALKAPAPTAAYGKASETAPGPRMRSVAMRGGSACSPSSLLD